MVKLEAFSRPGAHLAGHDALTYDSGDGGDLAAHSLEAWRRRRSHADALAGQLAALQRLLAPMVSSSFAPGSASPPGDAPAACRVDVVGGALAAAAAEGASSSPARARRDDAALIVRSDHSPPTAAPVADTEDDDLSCKSQPFDDDDSWAEFMA